LSHGGNLAEGSPDWLTLRKYLMHNSKSGIEPLYKNPKSPEHTTKNAKKQQSTEIKRIVNTKIQATLGPSFYVFTFSLAGGAGRFAPPLGPSFYVFTFSLAGGAGRFAPLSSVNYATDQVHFKYEQPQVLLIESHVTIGTIQQTQDVASVL